jgi:Holliday junction resolvasome RuvABC endonuclease subunit
MTIVSIDFSILYPGICIVKDFKDFKWSAIVNTKITKKEKENLDALTKLYPNLSINYTSSKRKTEAEYHLTERTKLINYQELIDLIIKEILEKTDDDNIICAIEGISYGSKGNALVDISQSTGILKIKLIEEVLKNQHERLFVFSPSELKNAIGAKGNAGKLDIFNKFKTDPVIESVKESDLFKAVNSQKWIQNGEKIVSPIIDMVDSYLGVAKIYQLSK